MMAPTMMGENRIARRYGRWVALRGACGRVSLNLDVRPWELSRCPAFPRPCRPGSRSAAAAPRARGRARPGPGTRQPRPRTRGRPRRGWAGAGRAPAPTRAREPGPSGPRSNCGTAPSPGTPRSLLSCPVPSIRRPSPGTKRPRPTVGRRGGTRHLIEPLLERAQRVGPRRLELGLDLARVEAQRAAEPARDPLHRPVVEQAEHVHPGDEPVAGTDHQPAAELGAEAAVPERLLHRDGELGRAWPRPADRLELADRAQRAGDEAAKDDGAAGVALEVGAVGPDALVAGVPAEPQPAVLAVEAQEVLRQQSAALARCKPAEARGGGSGSRSKGVRHRSFLEVGTPNRPQAARSLRVRPTRTPVPAREASALGGTPGQAAARAKRPMSARTRPMSARFRSSSRCSSCSARR